MKKRTKCLSIALVCLLLLGITGCAPKKTEVLIPVSMRFQDWMARHVEESMEEATGQDVREYAGGYDFQYDENYVLQKITTIGRSEVPQREFAVTTDEEGRILFFQSTSGNHIVTPVQESFLWTSRGNLLTHTRVDSKGEKVLRREYDAKNRILSAALTAPGKEAALFYEYAEDGKLVSASHYSRDTLMCKTEFTCLEDGRLATETLLDAKGEKYATASYEYPEDGSTRVTVTQKTLVSTETIVNEYGSTVTRPITPTVRDIVTVYTYDKAGFLIEEFYGEDSRENMHYEYTYITVPAEKATDIRFFPVLETLSVMGILDQLTVDNG